MGNPYPSVAEESLPPGEQAAGVVPEQMQAGSLLLRMQSGYTVATRVNTDIDLDVSGPVARTRVRQVFRNDGQEWVEAVYVFPLPEAAAVDRLRMQIGERVVEGEILEKEQAKKDYDAAKQAGRGAALVEQQRANLFTTHVANVEPGATVTIEIGYLETLRYDDGAFSVRIPLTLTPRYIPGTPLPGRRGSGWAADTASVPDASQITPPVVTTSADHEVTLHADIDAGVPLEHILSRYHPITVTAAKGTGHRYQVDLHGAQVPMDHDLELVWKPVAAAAPRATLFSETVGGEAHFLLMVLPPDVAVEKAQPMPRDLVLVVDTSGSMHGTSMEQAKEALLLALDGLTTADRFNVIQFNSVTQALFDASVAATPGNLDRARQYVRALATDGGTEMVPALELALASRADETHLKQVIFVTDGSVGNEAELYSLIEARLGTARLFTVGIGSAPNGWFMQKAAEAGRGTATFISALHEVKEKMGGLFRKLEQPQVTGIEVEWPGQGTLAYPALVPDLYAGEPIVVKARLAAPPRDGDQVMIRGYSPSGRWGTELVLAGRGERAGIAAIWARARIEDLLDAERRGGDAAATRAAVIETALAHHLVSRYTSLVAVDKTPVRPAAEALEREQVPNLLPYGQSMRAIFGFAQTATGWQAQAARGTVLVLLALLVWGFCRHLRKGMRSDDVAAA
jgi:Ca-activated chloride channel family protein